MKSRYLPAVISTVLLDLVLIAWGATYRNGFWLSSVGDVWTVQAYHGVIAVAKTETWGRSPYYSIVDPHEIAWLGFDFRFGYPAGNWNYKHLTALAVPFWFLALLTAIAPFRYIRNHSHWWLFRRPERRGFPIVTDSTSRPPPQVSSSGESRSGIRRG